LHPAQSFDRHGIPLEVVLSAGREVRIHADAVAGLFIRLIRTHVLTDTLGHEAPAEVLGAPGTADIAKTIERLRPLAKAIVDAELSMAMDRRIRAELDTWLNDRRQD
jgi:hypothetical protein